MIKDQDSGKILVVEDEEMMRYVLSNILRKSGFIVLEASDSKSAIEIFQTGNPMAVLLDLKLPDMNGLEVLQAMKKIDREVPVIVVTGISDIETAVDATKLGAYDYVVKSPKYDRLLLSLKRAIEKYEMGKSLNRLSDAVKTQLESLIGSSASVMEVIEQTKRVALSDFSVIIQGETGTGKTFLARLICSLGKRAKKPFVHVDIGTLPETLIESELFGYETGAFTDAKKKKKGFFEMADGGTMLIDDLQNIPLSCQGKLLRVVEDKQFYPVGSTTTRSVDVRLIATTNIDIREAVRQKKFREDLFFRLGEFIISLPPLRERTDDIPSLACKFLTDAAEELDRPSGEIADDAMIVLKCYSWPGNIRELKIVIRRALLLSSDNTIRAENLELLIGEKTVKTMKSEILPLRQITSMVVRDAESKAIRDALDYTKGNKTKAADLLQIDYNTLFKKIKAYGIK